MHYFSVGVTFGVSKNLLWKKYILYVAAFIWPEYNKNSYIV